METIQQLIERAERQRQQWRDWQRELQWYRDHPTFTGLLWIRRRADDIGRLLDE